MMTLRFTEKQRAILDAWPLQYSTLDEQLSDNHSVTDVAELAQATGMAFASIKPILASLSKRGIVMAGDEQSETGAVQQWLTEDGVEAVFALRGDGDVDAAEAPEQTGNTAAGPVTCKEVATALYAQKGDVYATVGNVQLKVVKGALWDALMQTPDVASPVSVERVGDRFVVTAV